MSETKTVPPVITSDLYKLNWRDFIKGLLMAAISTPVSIILTSFSQGQLAVDWKLMGQLAIGAAATYLLKNLFTPSLTQSPTNPVAK